MSLQQSLDFLADLSRNNDKAWFDAHRERYRQARGAFEGLVADVIEALRPVDDMGPLLPGECIFRINRDVRFSKDKSPYKTTMSAAIGRGGRHGGGRTYFLQIAPGDSFVGGGMFEPGREALDNLRQHLVRDAAPLRAILAAPEFVRYFGAIRGDALKTAPAGYDRDHPAIDLLRFKQMLAVHRIPDDEVIGDGVAARIAAACAAMGPFVAYLEVVTAAPPRD